MARQTTQKRKAVGVTAANGPTPKGFEVSHVTTFERPDLLILLGLAVVTFGIYAQVIGHRFTTFDDLAYIQENSNGESRCYARRDSPGRSPLFTRGTGIHSRGSHI